MGDSPLSAALEYARRGLHVFPCHGIVNGECTCGRGDCTSPGKHPRTSRGLLEATTDHGQVRRWWRTWPTANVGIACGPSRLVVLDIDPRHDGNASLATLEREHGELPDTPRSLTGSYNGSGRGVHLYFRAPFDVEVQSGANVLGEGIDVRAAGGYVIAPPSEHISGVTYQWDVGSPNELAALPPGLIPARQPKPVSSGPTNGKIGAGSRNASLTAIAGAMRRQGLDPEAILDALRVANASCEPPLPEREMETIARSVGRYEPAPAAVEQDPNVEDINVLFPLATTIKAEDVEWILPGWIPRGFAVSVEGDTAAGKSSILASLCARITSARALPQSKVIAPVEPWAWITEDPASYMLVPRLRAAGADMAKVRILDKAKGTVIIPDGLPLLERLLAEHGVRHVVLDPAVDYFSSQVDALKDQSVAGAMGRLVALAEKYRAVFYLVRHFTKGGGTKVKHRAAGAARIGNACRAKWSVTADPERPDTSTAKYRVLSSHDLNVGVEPPGLTLTISGDTPLAPPRVTWDGLSEYSADELLQKQDEVKAPTGERVTRENVAQVARETLERHGQSARLWIDGCYQNVAKALPSKAEDGVPGFYALVGVSKNTTDKWGGDSCYQVATGREHRGHGRYFKYLPDAKVKASREASRSGVAVGVAVSDGIGRETPTTTSPARARSGAGVAVAPEREPGADEEEVFLC